MRMSRRRTVVLTVAATAIASVQLIRILKAYWNTVAHIPQWDYLCFWLYGQALARHLDPYGPRSLVALVLPRHVSADFAREVLAVGIPYPPWSLPLFRMLGLFQNVRYGAVAWCAVEFLAMLGAIYVLGRRKSHGWTNVAVVAAVIVLSPASLLTAYYAQTIPLTLLFLALFTVGVKRADGGLWLAAAAIVKPFVLLVFVVPLLRRDWRQFAVAVVTISAFTGIGMLVAGPTVISNYVRESPIARTPGSVLTEPNNVPISAYILRATHVEPHDAMSLPSALVALDVALTAIGIAAASLVARRDPLLAVSIMLTLSLLVYPQSNAHYAQLLVLPLLILCRRWRLEHRSLVGAGLVFLVYALLSIRGGEETMYATLLVWLVCLWISVRDSMAARGRRLPLGVT